ncbi:MAG TPA: GDP-mannose dehydrogenase [Nitrosopumilaceae archaeon]|nr:GDP-mannose dehydrogenase [Nitrosopumilaceae archaeon]
MQSKDVVAGLGEIGMPIMKLISKSIPTIGYDKNEKLVDSKKHEKFVNLKTRLLHICIPFSDKFPQDVVNLSKRFSPEGIVIHSTISPGTTKKIQSLLSIPVMYSATRGVHKRMLNDLRRYTKFYAIEEDAPRRSWAITSYEELMKKSKVKTKRMSKPISLELAKIVVDTSYYGWLINYAQLSKMIAIKNQVDYDEMWSFADEIHKFLGNRPKMFPGFIGGHCVIPNLDLIQDDTLNLIKEINLDYSKILKKRQK